MTVVISLKRVALVAGVLIAFVAGVLVAVVMGSAWGGKASANPAVPNPGHSWSQIELPPGTWPDLDADLLDGYHAADLLYSPSGRLVELGTATVAPGSYVYFSPVDVSDCPSLLYTAQATDDLEPDGDLVLEVTSSPDGTKWVPAFYSARTHGTMQGVTVAGQLISGRYPYLRPGVFNDSTISTDVTAWLWCAW